MCGIFGICYGPGGATNEELTPTQLAQLLFPAIVHRGRHAFGWMSYSGGDEVVYQKYPGHAGLAHNLRLVDVDQKAQWFVGHVRFATHGTPADNRNNHPIHHGNILGVHNGVIRNHREILAETGRQDEETEVDSEAIFAAVDKWGARAGMERLTGDMVSAHVDLRKPDTLCIARTIGRPLVYGRTKAGSFIFASEPRVLAATGLEVVGDLTALKRFRRYYIREGRVVQRRTMEPPEPPVETYRIDEPQPTVQVRTEGRRSRRRRGQATPADDSGSSMVAGIRRERQAWRTERMQRQGWTGVQGITDAMSGDTTAHTEAFARYQAERDAARERFRTMSPDERKAELARQREEGIKRKRKGVEPVEGMRLEGWIYTEGRWVIEQ